ncbi:hypothetical protein B0T22DRAFT_476985 [Podospora appendiculata]|uniref:Uncharacterized protein n=1 Tax=Podospora appendiculata TaxID=314037 RepID=A0AAE0XIX5_9PEZI|nr:hypothetical protein B0T22DRAFT_476985 [Podospora appendiculata]
MPKRRATSRKAWLGQTLYHLDYPPSEQYCVLRVATKLNSKGKDLSQINFTKDEIEGFASVYVRLYQVPAKNQVRLQTWRDANQRLVRDWGDLGGFWNSQQGDLQLGWKPRKPGVPPEAVPEQDGGSTQNDINEMDVDSLHKVTATVDEKKNNKSTSSLAIYSDTIVSLLSPPGPPHPQSTRRQEGQPAAARNMSVLELVNSSKPSDAEDEEDMEVEVSSESGSADLDPESLVDDGGLYSGGPEYDTKMLRPANKSATTIRVLPDDDFGGRSH